MSFCNVDFNHLGVVGDVNEQSIQEIWRSPVFERYRQLHKQGRWDEIDLCRDCNYWAYTRNVWYPHPRKGWM